MATSCVSHYDSIANHRAFKANVDMAWHQVFDAKTAPLLGRQGFTSKTAPLTCRAGVEEKPDALARSLGLVAT
jgi:hypothetical protein